MKGIDKTAASISEGKMLIERNSELSETAKRSLEDIIKASRDNEIKIGEMADILEGMKKLSKNVFESMSSLSAINDENAGAIEQTANSSVEIKDQVFGISKSAQLFFDMAQSQQDLMSQFRIREEN